MPDRLSVPDIANIIGVEEDIIRRTLERHDEELLPYLHVEPIVSSHGDEPSQAEEDGGENEFEQCAAVRMLSVEGLPTLLTKLAFNIPTSDLIENLACQVLHLTVLQEDNAELEREKQALEQQNDQLQQRVEKAGGEVEVLKSKIMELQSRGWFRNLFGRQKLE